jgi:hypothetical protein
MALRRDVLGEALVLTASVALDVAQVASPSAAGRLHSPQSRKLFLAYIVSTSRSEPPIFLASHLWLIPAFGLLERQPRY